MGKQARQETEADPKGIRMSILCRVAGKKLFPGLKKTAIRFADFMV